MTVSARSRVGPEHQHGHIVAQPAHRGVHDRALDALGDLVGAQAAAVREQLDSCSVPNTSRRWRRTSVTPSV